MTEPQVWTLIGVFAASLGIMITLVVTLMTSIATSLRTEMRLGFDGVGKRLERSTVGSADWKPDSIISSAT